MIRLAPFPGRLDAEVEVQGVRVEPDEVACALLTHPAVRQAAVTTWEPREDDTRLVAYVVPADGPAAGPVQLRAHLVARLPAHMVPDTYVCLDSLPRTSSGRVDRPALPPPFAAARGHRVTSPRSPIEERLAGTVTAVMRLERLIVERLESLRALPTAPGRPCRAGGGPAPGPAPRRGRAAGPR